MSDGLLRSYRAIALAVVGGLVAVLLARGGEGDFPHPQIIAVLGGLGTAATWWLLSRPAFARRFVGRATPGTLGATRVAVCAVLAAMTYLEQTNRLPHARIRLPMGIMDWLYAAPLGLGSLVQSHTALVALKAVTIAVLLVGAAGWRTRLVLPLGAALWLVLAGVVRSYTVFTHNGVVPFYMLIVLCFTRCADGFSLDRMLRAWRGLPVEPARVRRRDYAWGRYAIWTILALTYVSAGAAKLREGGLMWWNPSNMQRMLFKTPFGIYDNWRISIETLQAIPTWVYGMMGLLALMTEIGMGFVLVSRAARLVMPVITLGMHAGIYVMQGIRFWDLCALQTVFYDWTALRRRAGRWLVARRGRVSVSYWRRDAVAASTVRVLRGLDLLGRLRFHPVDVPVRGHFAAILRGRSGSGMEALRIVAGVVPALWPAAAALAVPGPASIVRAAVRALWQRSSGTPVSSFSASSRAARSSGPAMATATLAVLVFCYAFKVSYYPFTAMRMYSGTTAPGVLRYYYVTQTDESGRTTRAYLNRLAPGTNVIHQVLWKTFQNDAGRARSADALRYCGERWNATAAPGQRLVSIEVQYRRWDFLKHPRDPNHGEKLDQLVVPLHPIGTELAQSKSQE